MAKLKSPDIGLLFNVLLNPYLDLEFRHIFIRAGVGVGIGFGDYIFFVLPDPIKNYPLSVDPWVEIGYRFYLNFNAIQ